MRDLYNNIIIIQPLNPVVATVAKTSTAIDLQGFDAASVVFSIGASGDTLAGGVYWTLKLQHSDDDSVYTDVVLAELNSPAATVVVNSLSLDETAYSFGYVGGKRYVKAVATPTGTHTNGTPIGIIAVRGKPAYKPVV